MDDQHERIGLGGAQNHMMADLKTAKQMHMRDNITNSLKTAGFTDQTSSEIYEAIGVLAKHQIMVRLGGRSRFGEGSNIDFYSTYPSSFLINILFSLIFV